MSGGSVDENTGFVHVVRSGSQSGEQAAAADFCANHLRQRVRERIFWQSNEMKENDVVESKTAIIKKTAPTQVRTKCGATTPPLLLQVSLPPSLPARRVHTRRKEL